MQRRLNPDAPKIVESRHLVSPDRDRITPERLAGMLWRDTMDCDARAYAPDETQRKEFGVDL